MKLDLLIAVIMTAVGIMLGLTIVRLLTGGYEWKKPF